ncbi:MAG: zf-HC2 domain-containing protein [Bacteroidetes bacterium]|nr:zf-HC2 domain-containing protein [Bacteroidota bacterium]MCW5895653.1 zf-HC2 domain-containing protein [Bacteroidota bacterium]
MNCNEYQELVSALMDNELQEPESATTFHHLGECKRCRNYMRTLLQLRSALTASKEVAVPATLDEKVLSMPLHTATSHRSRFSEFWKEKFAVPAPALAAAFLLLIASLATSMLFLSERQTKKGEPQKVVYVIGLQPVEVQGTHNQTHHDIQ